MGPLTLAIACRTPKPWYRPGSASRSSSASCSPVDAPLGTAARPSAPSSRTTSTSTVGFPRESRISGAETSSISDMAGRWYRTFRAPTGGSAVGLPRRRLRELPEGAHRVEPDVAVELLRPIGGVRDQEDDVGGVARRADRGREERARDAAVPVRLQRVDALDLGDTVADVELAGAHDPAVDPGREEPGADPLDQDLPEVRQYLRALARGATVCDEVRLDDERSDGPEVHLGDLERRRFPVGLAPKRQIHEAVGVVAELDQPCGDPGALGVVVEHELAMPEAFEGPVGLGRELGRRSAADRALDPQEVAVPPIGEPVVVQRRAEAPRLDPCAG